MTAVLPVPLATVLLAELALPTGAEPKPAEAAAAQRAGDQVTVSAEAPLLALWHQAETGLQSLAQALPQLARVLSPAAPVLQPTSLGQIAQVVGQAARAVATVPSAPPPVVPAPRGTIVSASQPPPTGPLVKPGIQPAPLQIAAAAEPPPALLAARLEPPQSTPLQPRLDALARPDGQPTDRLPYATAPAAPPLRPAISPASNSPAALYAAVALGPPMDALPLNPSIPAREHLVERWRDDAGLLLHTADTLLDRAEQTLQPATIEPLDASLVPNPAALWAMAQVVQARRDVNTALVHIGRGVPGRSRSGFGTSSFADPIALLRRPVALFGALLVSLVFCAMLWVALGAWYAAAGLTAALWTWRIVVSARKLRLQPA